MVDALEVLRQEEQHDLRAYVRVLGHDGVDPWSQATYGCVVAHPSLGGARAGSWDVGLVQLPEAVMEELEDRKLGIRPVVGMAELLDE
ncbi:hypothetical protein ACTWPT_06640 [Nonomuraea sp. 3N208]|uniref:hypothetical protein n=1 Tax=Nonomuraea sp. 3N208 TaxID=3457421 RepID=UPI003FCD763A